MSGDPSNYDFIDVTNVFIQAASGKASYILEHPVFTFFSLEMGPADMYFMEGFGLLEAMSAIEVCNAIVNSVLTHTAE